MAKIREPEASYVVDQKGRRMGVILSVEDYERLIEDIADLSAIAARKKEHSVSWERIKKRLKKDGLL